MIKQIKYKNVTWLDVSAPTREEIDNLARKYNLHPVATEELILPSSRSKVDWYEDYIYLTLHFPTNSKKIVEIDFILGQDFVLTTHYEVVPPLAEFAQILDGGSDGKKEKSFHAGHLFYYMIRELYGPLEAELDGANHRLKQIEEKIFAGHEDSVVRDLSQINRQLLDIKWALKFHHEVLNSLVSIGKEFYGDKFNYYLQAIIGEYERIAELVKSNREIFTELHNTNESLLVIKNNRMMRWLTALVALFSLISLIGLFLTL